MSNIISNEKRHHQDKKKHILIHSQMSAIKTQIKKTHITKDQKELHKAFKMIDSGVSKGVITKNKGNRLKSRLTIFVNDVTKKYVAKDLNKKKTTTKKIDKNIKNNLKLTGSKKAKVISKKKIKNVKPISKKKDKVAVSTTKVVQKVSNAKPIHVDTKPAKTIVVEKTKKPISVTIAKKPSAPAAKKPVAPAKKIAAKKPSTPVTKKPVTPAKKIVAKKPSSKK
ncbi:MAG: 30S ribosomal protein S20 [Malacoplasma sp.]